MNKKRTVSIIAFFLVAIFALSNSAFASLQTSQEEMVTYNCPSDIEDIAGLDSFGGMYYDESGTLIVNMASTDLHTLNSMNTLASSDIVYASVTYPLATLESIVDSLTPYMKEYKISVLDANDMTNKVDIYLKDFSTENIAAIKEFVGTELISEDTLNFIDYSDIRISFEPGTVDAAKIAQNEEAALVDDPSQNTLVPGNSIYINNSMYTLGPKRTSTTSYTAGHLVPLYASVDVVDMIHPDWIAKGALTVTNTKVSGNCDAAVLSFNGSGLSHTSLLPNYSMSNPVVGTQVTMIGAASRATKGAVNKTNATVYYDEVGVTLTGLGAGTYSCQKGDSGAPIFNRYSSFDTITTCYGVQSGGAFDTTGGWAGTSFFTMAGNLP